MPMTAAFGRCKVQGYPWLQSEAKSQNNGERGTGEMAQWGKGAPHQAQQPEFDPLVYTVEKTTS